jgi:hypothetical protein
MNKKLSLFFVTLMILSCDKNNGNVSDYYQDELYSYYYNKERDVVYSVKNVPGKGSKEWKANAGVFKMGKAAFPEGKFQDMYYFNFATYSHFEKTWQREDLSMQYIPIKEGKTFFSTRNQDLDSRPPQTHYARIGADGDVLMRGWFVSEYKESSLTIHKIDSLNKIIHYSFDLYFEFPAENPLYPSKPSQRELPNYKWSKNINFLGGHGVVDFPK